MRQEFREEPEVRSEVEAAQGQAEVWDFSKGSGSPGGFTGWL